MNMNAQQIKDKLEALNKYYHMIQISQDGYKKDFEKTHKFILDQIVSIQRECSLQNNFLVVAQDLLTGGRTRYNNFDMPYDRSYTITQIKDNRTNYELTFYPIHGGNWVTRGFKGFGSKSVNCFDVSNLDFNEKLSSNIKENLDKFLSTVKEKTGIVISCPENVLWHNGKPMPTSIKDLHVNGSKNMVVAASGNEPEPWAIIRNRRGNVCVWYSTNGFGLGYDQFIAPEYLEKEHQNFFKWFGGEEKLKEVISEKLISQLKKGILNKG